MKREMTKELLQTLIESGIDEETLQNVVTSIHKEKLNKLEENENYVEQREDFKKATRNLLDTKLQSAIVGIDGTIAVFGDPIMVMANLSSIVNFLKQKGVSRDDLEYAFNIAMED